MTEASQSDVRRRKALADAIAGLAGSLVALWTFYPLDVWKTHLQADLVSFQQTNNNSWSLWYRGIGSKTLHSASSSFIYFYLESWVMTWYTQRRHRRQSQQPSSTAEHSRMSTLEHLILSAIAAILNTAITLPLDVISSVHQTSSLADDDSKRLYRRSRLSTIEEDDDRAIDSELLQQEQMRNGEVVILPPSPLTSNNISSLWKGLVPSLLLCSNPSIHYTVFDVLKHNMITRRNHSPKLSLVESFILGLLAKLTATLATYPLIRIKVLLMVTHRKSLLGTLVEEYHRDGVQGLYKGCNLQLTHTILKSALLMMVRERITSLTYGWMVPSDG